MREIHLTQTAIPPPQFLHFLSMSLILLTTIVMKPLMTLQIQVLIQTRLDLSQLPCLLLLLLTSF
jgi:hypothetical protein